MKTSTEFKIVLFLGALAMVFMFAGIDTQVVGEQLCVDGSHNINLEGMMCEKSESTWFGLNHWFMLLTLIPFCSFALWSVFFGNY